MPAPLQTFIIYARADGEHKRQLLLHLRPLVNSRLVSVWHDGQIQPGEDWEITLKTQLNASDLVLLLVSANSMNSEFIQSEELRIAFERLQQGQARIVPILVSPYGWRYDPVISPLEIRPLYRAEGPKAVTDGVWRNEHEAWASVVESLGDMIVEHNARLAKAEQLVRTAQEREELLKKYHDLLAEARQRLAQNDFDGAEALAVQAKHLISGPGALRLLSSIRKGRERVAKAGEDAERGRSDPFHDLMIHIKGGAFDMGDTFGDGRADEKPVHQVTLSDFQLCKYPVTQGQWKAVMGDNPSHFTGDDMLPVENVSWDDAQVFIRKLNEKTGLQYRLPTEAEWEYAAREGGKKVRFGNGKDLADPAEMNFNASEQYKKDYSTVGEYRQKTTPVDQFKPNALGLHDMSGNVWEWCQDWYDAQYYAQSAGQTDPTGRDSGESRVLRGGSWNFGPLNCRASVRSYWYPGSRNDHIGFRVARAAGHL